MPKLYNRREKKLVDVAPGDVSTALDSGQFSFQEGQKVPVNFKGRFMFTTPEAAGKYRDRLTFANEEDVVRQRAEERMSGVGGTLAGLGYGAAKMATFGLAPLALGAVSETARDYMRDIELGAPTATAVGELAGLAFDPLAAFGKKAATRAAGEVVTPALPTAERFLALPTSAPAQEVAATAAETRLLGRPAIPMPAAQAAEAAGVAAPAAEAAVPATEAAAPAARAAYRKPSLRSYGQAPLEGEVAAAEQAVGEAMVEPVVPPRPLRLGGRVASAEPAAGAGFAARDAALRPRALPPGGREAAVTPTEFEREAVDLSAFRPDERRGLPSAGRELRTEMQEAGKLEPFETAVANEGDLPYRANKQMISDEIDYALFEKNDLPRDEQRVRTFIDDVRKRTFDIETAIKNKAWMGETPPAVIEMDRSVASRTGAKITGTSDLKVAMSLREPGQLRRAIEAIEDTDVAAVLEPGLLNDLRFLTKPQEFQVRWNPSRPYGTPAPRASKNADGWIGAIRDKAGNTIDVAKGKRDDVERQLSDALRKYNTDVTKDVMSRLREYGRTVEQLGAERAANIEAARAQLSFADLSLPAVERVVAEPTAMTGRLEFGRGAGEVAAQRAAARQELQLGQLAAEREAQREAIRRGGLPPERVGPEPVGGLVLAGQPERIGVEEVMAAEDAARAQAAAVGAARQAPPGGAIVPYPTLPSGAADVGLRDAMVAQREAINARALPPRGIGVSDVQAAQRAAAEEVMRGRDMAATAELRGAVEADYAAGQYGVPPERGIVLGEQGPLATMPAAGAPPPAGGAPGVLSLGRGAEAAASPEAAAAAIDAARGTGRGITLGPQAAMAAQGAIYGGATEAQRQQLGLSRGGAGDIIASAFIGGAIPLGISALAKGAGAAGKLIAGAAGSDGLPLGEKIAKAAGRMEETAMLRMFGMSKANVRELNALFGRAEDDVRGTRKFIDYIKTSFADIERLKKEFPDNATLQGIRTDSFLKFGNLKPEQRVAFAEALKDSAGRAIEQVYKPFYQTTIPTSEIEAAIGRMRDTLIGKGALGDIPVESIRAELNALTNYIANGGTHTVGSLRSFENDISRIFREKAGVGKPFTDAQRVFRDEIKNLYVKAVDDLAPGAREALPLMNEAYAMSERLHKGALDKEAGLATQSSVGPDQFNAAALGAVGLGQPLSAARFLVATVALRGFYNQRADGFIADMAQRLGSGALKMQGTPRAAAQVAAQSMFDAKRPAMFGLSAQQFTSATPDEYRELAQSVREMSRNRSMIADQIMGATSNMPPDEQAAVMDKFDRIFQALGDNMPQNIEEPGRISEQARRYTVFARSLIDRAYATQVMANGGPDAAVAADALRQQGEDGQKYIDDLEEQLRNGINKSSKLQADERMMMAYRHIKSQSSKSGIRLMRGGLGGTIHGGLKLPSAGVRPSKAMSAAQVGKAVEAFTGLSGTKF